MSSVSTRIEQSVQLRHPDKQVSVLGPRGQETLVLDGQVDSFVRDQSSMLPLANLADAQKLLKTPQVARLSQVNPNREPNWMFYSGSKDVHYSTTLKVDRTREGRVVEYGLQKIVEKGNHLELTSRIPDCSHGGYTCHTIHGELGKSGRYVVTGEDYEFVSNRGGNIWQSVANVIG